MKRALIKNLLLLAVAAVIGGCTISSPDIHIRPPIQIEVGGDSHHHKHKHHNDHDD